MTVADPFSTDRKIGYLTSVNPNRENRNCDTNKEIAGMNPSFLWFFLFVRILLCIGFRHDLWTATTTRILLPKDFLKDTFLLGHNHQYESII